VDVVRALEAQVFSGGKGLAELMLADLYPGKRT
jgi:hypothetical protein